MHPANLTETIFTLLRSIEAAAVSRANAKVTGLNWYGGHHGQDSNRPLTEPAWSKNLVTGLTAADIASVSEATHPMAPRERCDHVVAGWTTAGEIRREGGEVKVLPEGDPINDRHVDVTVKCPTTFGPLEPNPAPKAERWKPNSKPGP